MKTCSKCGEDKPVEAFTWMRGKGRYDARCKSCVREVNQTYYKAHRERCIANAIDWADRNKETDRKRRSEYHWKRYRELKIAAFRVYGTKCVCCGEDSLGFLTLDHADEGGERHRKEIKRANFYHWLFHNNYPMRPRLQTLCYNCNYGRGRNGGICPHNDPEVQRLSEME